MYKNILIFGTISLFFISAITPITFGFNVRTSNEEQIVKSLNFDSYHISEITRNAPYTSFEEIINTDIVESNQIDTLKENLRPLDGPMDSPWPMYCHDTHHTGRSPYSTANNIGVEKWRFDTNNRAVTGSPVIDGQGVIYIGASDLFAVYPNGTLKWQFESGGIFTSAVVIDENGVIYVGIIWGEPNYLYAIYSNNGMVKWKFTTGDDIWSSPAIGDDGSIYFGCDDKNIYALYPNGTLKWKYQTGHVVYSSPAIGDEGIVYCGSHDTYLYALYPNNGTLKWRYKTGNWIRTAPCIGDDDVIYVVSLDNYLHAVCPNGTRKWKTDVGAGTSPTIGQDGTIYCGYSKLYAINPSDGSIKWSFDPGPNRFIRGGTPCNSIDGTIYFGADIGDIDGGEIIAVNPDGTEKWRKIIASNWIMSAPAIGEDGSIYVGSVDDLYHSHTEGYLHAFGELGPSAPSTPEINGPTNCIPGRSYTYNIVATSPVGRDLYYFIDWGDSHYTNWFGPFQSGETMTVDHKWDSNPEWINVINVQAKDTTGLLGYLGSLKVSMPRDKVTNNMLLLKLLEGFPLLQKILLFLTI